MFSKLKLLMRLSSRKSERSRSLRGTLISESVLLVVVVKTMPVSPNLNAINCDMQDCRSGWMGGKVAGRQADLETRCGCVFGITS